MTVPPYDPRDPAIYEVYSPEAPSWLDGWRSVALFIGIVVVIIGAIAAAGVYLVW